MKILVIAVLPPNPAAEANHAFYLCRHLAEHGAEVHVLTSKGSITSEYPGLFVHPIMRKWDWSELPRLSSFIRRCSPDAILLYYLGYIYNDNPMITFAPTLAKIIRPNIPFVTMFSHIFGATAQSGSFPQRLLHKGIRTILGKSTDYNLGSLLRDSSKIIVLSDNHRAAFEARLPGISRKSLLVPPPLIIRLAQNVTETTRRQIRESVNVHSDQFLFIYFGFIYPSKGVETLITAFHLLSQARHNVRLLIVGGVPSDRKVYGDEIHSLPLRLGIEDKVTFTGAFTWESEEGSNYLHAADACVLPFNEGVCMNNSSFAAAATHGLPVITTQGATLEEPFLDRNNVLLCPPKNPEIMAERMNELMRDTLLQQKLREGALQLAQEWFSWNKAVQQIINSLAVDVNQDREHE